MNNALILLFLTLIFMGQPVKSKAQKTGSDYIILDIDIAHFSDSNHDGIGDIQGATNQLPVIEKLGVNCVCLHFTQPGNSTNTASFIYSSSLYPQAGSTGDLMNLINQFHEKGIKVLLQCSFNQTNIRTAWFGNAVKGKEPYKSFYQWSKDSTGNNWHLYKGKKERYFSRSGKNFAALNYHFPPVQSEMTRLTQYWLQLGFDGMHVSGTEDIFGANEIDQNTQWWDQLKRAMKPFNPDFIFIGDIYLNKGSSTHYSPNIFTWNANPANTKIIEEAMRIGDGSAFLSNFTEQQKRDASSGNYIKQALITSESSFTEKIEQNRSLEILKNAILLSLPAIPIINHFHLPDSTYTQNASSTDSVSENDVRLKTLQQLIDLRNNHPAMRIGEVEQVPMSPPLMAYRCRTVDETVMVVHNLSNQTIAFERPNNSNILCLTNHSSTGSGIHIVLAPYGSVVFGF